MLRLQSSAFTEGELIPSLYTCDGENKNPTLLIEGAPSGTKSFTLIVDDPDIPQRVKDALGIDVFDHWVVFNIAPSTTEIGESSTALGVEGNNTKGVPSYRGPCPPDREHRYFFKLYALDILLPLLRGASRSEVEGAMQGHILESAVLMGRYERRS